MSALAGLDKRSRLLLGALAAAVLLLVARFVLLGGGAELEEPFTPVVPAVAAAAPAPAPLEVPAPAAGAVQAPPKDPFRALHAPGAPAAAPVADAPTAGGLDVGPAPEEALPQPEPVEVPAGPVLEVPAAGPAPQAPAPVEPVERAVVLRSVDGSTAVFTVDGVEQEVEVGESVAGLTLRALQEGPTAGTWTAVLQQAGSEPFDLVQGTLHRA